MNGLLHMHFQNATLKLLSNGMLFYEGLGAWKSEFCVDNFINGGGDEVFFSGLKCAGSLEDLVATQDFANDPDTVLCYGEEMQRFTARFRQAYLACGCLSVVFLAVTLFLYLTLPVLKNLHGNIVVGNVVSILFTTLALMVMFNVRPHRQHHDALAYSANMSRYLL